MSVIGNPFAFTGRIGRVPFVASVLGLLLIQQFAHHLLVGDYWFGLTAWANPWIEPLTRRWGAVAGADGDFNGLVYGLPIGAILVVHWIVVALAFRRAAMVDVSPGLAALALVPFVQIVVVVALATRRERADTTESYARARWQAAILGLLVGSMIAVGMAILFTLFLGTYGAGLFVGVPLFIGCAAGYAANRAGDIGTRATLRIATAALGLGALMLAGFALEGAVCLLMAFPLGAVLACLGGMAGRAWVVHTGFRQSRLMSVSVMPLLLAIEVLAPRHAVFESAESIDVAASPAIVWESVVHMGPIPDAPSAPFGWGLAYPQRGTIHGMGVGAIREGVFSTGVAYERVTRWEPGRALDFVVLSDPPALRELSPFAKVQAPHVNGYFKTRDARFAIAPLPNGQTRLTLTTTHELDIGPPAYWQLFAQWAVHANKQRVLEHFRAQAEGRR